MTTETKTEEAEKKLTQALAEWPLVEPSAAEWDRLSSQIDSKVIGAGGVLSALDDDVLGAPLPASPSEPQNSPALGSYRTLPGALVSESAPSSKDSHKMSDGPSSRDRRSLKDLAKLASAPSLTPAPPKVIPTIPSERPSAPKMGGDSGIVDLKAMSTRDPGAALRAESTPLASAALFDEDEGAAADSVAPPPSAGEPAAPVASSRTAVTGPISAPVSRPSAAAAIAPPVSAGKSSFPLVAGAIGLVAVAAMVFMFMRARPDARVATNAPVAAPPAATAAPLTPSATAAPAAGPQAVVAAESPVQTSNTVDPAALPAGGKGAVGGGRKSYSNSKAAPVLGGGGGSTVSGLSAMMAQATKPAEGSASDPPPPPAAPGALGAAVKQAVGSTGEAATPQQSTPSGPQFAPGSVPEKPSQGAVTGALGVVLPQARNCLNPDDPISRANVTFSSSGSVSRVVVTGSAAGKPAEECIKSALMKASVPPFAQPTYAATITVRPN